jgi:DNA repair protein RecO (recombination protein O)
MLQTTRGIVFQQLKYGESSIIVRIYTESLGLQSYMIRGFRRKSSRIRPAHLQHLTLVELEVNQRDNKSLQHLKELRVVFPYSTLPFDVKKSAVAVFLNEILNKTIREEEANPGLFRFLESSFQFLDTMTGSISLFHHAFLIRLSKFLGFFPKDNYTPERSGFNLLEGEFTSGTGPKNTIAPPDIGKSLHRLLNLDFERMGTLRLKSSVRQELLEMLLNYYRHHVPGLTSIKSAEILKEVFGN